MLHRTTVHLRLFKRGDRISPSSFWCRCRGERRSFARISQSKTGKRWTKIYAERKSKSLKILDLENVRIGEKKKKNIILQYNPIWSFYNKKVSEKVERCPKYVIFELNTISYKLRSNEKLLPMAKYVRFKILYNGRMGNVQRKILDGWRLSHFFFFSSNR